MGLDPGHVRTLAGKAHWYGRAMASYSVNDTAVRRCRERIKARQYVLDSDWGEVQPNAEAENAFLEIALVDRVLGVAPRLHRRRERRDQGEVRVRLRRSPPRSPQRTDCLRLPGGRVASQGRGAGGPRPAPAARPDQRLSPQGSRTRSSPALRARRSSARPKAVSKAADRRTPGSWCRASTRSSPRRAVGLEVGPSDDPVPPKQGQHVVAVDPLGSGLVDLHHVPEAEQALGEGPVPEQVVEGRQERGGRRHPLGQLGLGGHQHRRAAVVHGQAAQQSFVRRAPPRAAAPRRCGPAAGNARRRRSR